LQEEVQEVHREISIPAAAAAVVVVTWHLLMLFPLPLSQDKPIQSLSVEEVLLLHPNKAATVQIRSLLLFWQLAGEVEEQSKPAPAAVGMEEVAGQAAALELERLLLAALEIRHSEVRRKAAMAVLEDKTALEMYRVVAAAALAA
jgi:hypothetical protein